MKKDIFILNGMGGSGKDTFVEFLNKITPAYHYSSVSKVKKIASRCGWNGGKTEKDRKFLSDLKRITTEYSDMSFNDIKDVVNIFNDLDYWYNVIVIDIREPEEIERAKKEFDAKTILIKNDRVPFIESNASDSSVYDYEYDIVIENNGTLDDFKEAVRKFAKEWIK